ncbi:MAG: alpha/beta hydrolase-fold protein, partial [Gemmatimonadota bacterium]
MNVEYEKRRSRCLDRDMELKIYGRSGKPAVVFPSAGGRFFEYEDFGMVDACRPAIDAGKLVLFTVDSVDRESWMNEGAHPADRARRHNDYDRYIVDEVVPYVR